MFAYAFIVRMIFDMLHTSVNFQIVLKSEQVCHYNMLFWGEGET